MTDPITCPECGGQRGQRFGPLMLACRFCAGRGWVGGEHEPAQAAEQAPPPPPTATGHKIWADPAMSAAFPCRLCFGSRKVVHVDEQAGTVVQVPCACSGGAA